MSDVLTRILETKAEEIQAGKNRQSVQELRLRCQQAEPTRGFRQALAARIGRHHRGSHLPLGAHRQNLFSGR